MDCDVQYCIDAINNRTDAYKMAVLRSRSGTLFDNDGELIVDNFVNRQFLAIIAGDDLRGCYIVLSRNARTPAQSEQEVLCTVKRVLATGSSKRTWSCVVQGL